MLAGHSVVKRADSTAAWKALKRAEKRAVPKVCLRAVQMAVLLADEKVDLKAAHWVRRLAASMVAQRAA